jgi:hypothetical protein
MRVAVTLMDRFGVAESLVGDLVEAHRHQLERAIEVKDPK